MKTITATNKFTGEVVEFKPETYDDLVTMYRECSETIKAYEAAKKQLQLLAEPYIDAKGTSEVSNGYMFRQMSIQRMNYDKSVMREVLDEDLYDLLLVPDKPRIDTYLKENLADLGDQSTRLRNTMLPSGKPYSVTKLEKIA